MSHTTCIVDVFKTACCTHTQCDVLTCMFKAAAADEAFSKPRCKCPPGRTSIMIVMSWAGAGPSPSQHAGLLALPALRGCLPGAWQLHSSTGTLFLLPQVCIAVCMHI